MGYKIERHEGRFFGNVTITAPNEQKYSLTITRLNQVLDIYVICKNGSQRPIDKGGKTWMKVKNAYYEEN